MGGYTGTNITTSVESNVTGRRLRKPHAYGNANGHVHSDGNGDSDRRVHAYRNSYGYSYCDSHPDSNSNADRDAVAAAYTYATALALSGIKFPASNLFKKLDQCRSRPLQGGRSAS